MSLLVTEEPGHPAATGVHDLDIGGETEQRSVGPVPTSAFWWQCPCRRTGAPSLAEALVELEHRLLEEAGGSASFRRARLGEKLPVVVAQGQDAARFEADERDATLDEGRKEIQVSPGVLSRLVDEPFESIGLPQQTTSGRCIFAPAAAKSLTAPSPTSGLWYSFQVSLKSATSAGPAPCGSSGKRLEKVLFATRGNERRGSMPARAAAWRARRVPATAL